MVHVTAETVHFHYDVEKPGYRGFDRRHFPEQRSATTELIFKPRVHFQPEPSTNLDELWRPHGRHKEPSYTNIGPDWNSRIRSISAPRHPDAKPTLPVALIENNVHFVRPFPQNWHCTTNEWRYFTDAPLEQQSSKRNIFNRVHLRSIEDLGDENMLMSMIGRKKRVADLRNGLSKRHDGDKNYDYVEQSSEFYKFGATIPQVNFGQEKKGFKDRRSILQLKDEKIPIVDRNDFIEKERRRDYETMITEVAQLEKWKPAERVKSAFKVFEVDPNEKHGSRYRPRVR